MRKALIATIVAMVLFAVGAFAATLDLDDESVASGEAEVVACDETPEVDFEVGDYVNGDWPIVAVNVTTRGCADGTDVEIVLLDGGSQVSTGSGQISGGSVRLDVTDTPVEPVDEYALLLNGDPVATAPAP